MIHYRPLLYVYTKLSWLTLDTTLDRSSRNWRYHTALKLWLTKDTASDIRQISETAEKGVYVFFDPQNWERVRVSFNQRGETHVWRGKTIN